MASLAAIAAATGAAPAADGSGGGDDIQIPPTSSSGTPGRLLRQLTGTADADDIVMAGDTVDAIVSEVEAEAAAAAAAAGENKDASASSEIPEQLPAPSVNLRFHAGGLKDEGVRGKQNQDDFFIWQRDPQTLVIAILDGHGRELGQLASKAAKDSIFADLTSDERLRELRSRPHTVMREILTKANDAIRTAFVQHYTNRGVEVKVEPGGFIVKRSNPAMPFGCVHGGTTVTLAVILEGRILISANVGDSSALLLGLGSDLDRAKLFASHPFESCAAAGNEGAHSYAVISAEHSPETPSEYVRMREFRPSKKKGPLHPEMLFVYDSPSFSKFSCPSVFHVDPNSGVPVVTNNGRYYKSVRNEWATLVTTPPNSRFQDALAFTRSVGDLHLQTYGVSCVPDVSVLDLNTLFTSGRGGGLAATAPAILFVASDGIHDNFKFDVLSNTLGNLWGQKTAPAAGDASPAVNPDGIHQGTDNTTLALANAFMEVNKREAYKNFGNSADNMSLVVCTIYPAAM